MRLLAIKTTIYPTGESIIWEGAIMPQHKYYAMDDTLFNRWTAYLHAQVNKIKGINKIKPGGVAYIDGQESALRLAREILQ
jgi:hypothetical protein